MKRGIPSEVLPVRVSAVQPQVLPPTAGWGGGRIQGRVSRGTHFEGGGPDFIQIEKTCGKENIFYFCIFIDFHAKLGWGCFLALDTLGPPPPHRMVDFLGRAGDSGFCQLNEGAAHLKFHEDQR